MSYSLYTIGYYLSNEPPNMKAFLFSCIFGFASNIPTWWCSVDDFLDQHPRSRGKTSPRLFS